MASNLDLYRREIFNFLRTVTIKFEPFAYLMGEPYMAKYGITNPHGKWNPYYIHLAGEYTAEEIAAGNVMHVYTVEHELPEDVVFDKTIKLNFKKTAALYRIPNVEYEHLEEKYPEYTGLLRCMVYPVKDIDTAIAAPNLSLLAYDDSLLEVNERESIVSCLKDFLDMVRTRWWIEEYTYEDMYAVTFWAMLWQMLPMVLLGKRFENIRTPYVHSFHVWEYLKSKGLGDYRDVLTTEQSLWLYRNIDYILRNKGKASTLKILAENLLADAFVALRYVDMQQDISNFDDTLHTLPQFIFHNYITDKEEKVNQLDDLNPKLYELGLSDKDGPEYIHNRENELGSHAYNLLPTKYLELKKERIDTSSQKMMVTFFLHSLMYRFANGKLEYSVTVNDIYTGSKVKLYINDMICLLYYTACKSVGITPTYIPTGVRVRVPYTLTVPDTITKEIRYGDKVFPINELVNVDGVLGLIPFENRVFVSVDHFAEFINRQFDAYYFLFKQMEQSNKYLYHKALRRLLDDLTVNEFINVHLSDHTTYEDWINSNSVVKAIFTEYDSLEHEAQCNAYKTLSMVCYDGIFDTADGKTGVNTIRKMDSIYDAIRDLFISLCSYNITFIDAKRDVVEYLTVEEPDFIVGLNTNEFYGKEGSVFNLIVSLTDYLSSDHFRYKLKMRLNDIEIMYTMIISRMDVVYSHYVRVWLDYYRKCIMIYRLPITQRVYTVTTEKNNTIRTRFVLHTGVDNTCKKIEG